MGRPEERARRGYAVGDQWAARYEEKQHGAFTIAGSVEAKKGPSPDDIGEGEHIKVLLKFAQHHQRTIGVSAEYDEACAAVITDWNAWIKAEREKDTDFKIQLKGFNGDATAWKSTPLWGKQLGDFWGKKSGEERLYLFDIDWRGARLDEAHLEAADLTRARLDGANLSEAHLEGALMENADLKGAAVVDAHLEGAWLRWAHLEEAGLGGTHLEKAYLEEAHLERASLRAAHLEGAFLTKAHLEGAFLTRAHLEGTFLPMAHLEGADLWNAHLEGAGLAGAYLNGADLTEADLEGAELWKAHLEEAWLNAANFTKANVLDIHYRHYSGIWPFRRNLMLGHYLGIRGVEACYGSPNFRRDALDQDFIDQKHNDCELLIDADEIKSKWLGWLLNARPVCFLRSVRWGELHERIPRRCLFWLWSWSDYGRSTLGVTLYVAATIGVIGALYQYVLVPQHHVVLTGGSAGLPFAAWYAAGMGAATLGLTDLMKPLDAWGQLAMFGNALSGLMLFGMMVAVLQNKVARRS